VLAALTLAMAAATADPEELTTKAVAAALAVMRELVVLVEPHTQIQA